MDSSKATTPAGQDPRPAGPAERAGDLLRAAREARGISVEETAKKLKTHVRYIQAIEASDYNQLPGDAYTRVYLRSLCAFLSLNPEEILERFFKERGVTGVDTLRKDSSTKINLALKEKSKPNVTLIVIGCLIAFLAAFSFIANHQGWLSSARHAAGPAADSTRQTARPPDSLTIGIPKENDTAAPRTAAAITAPAPSALPKNSATAPKPGDQLLKQQIPEPQQKTDSTRKTGLPANSVAPFVKKDTIKPAPMPLPAAAPVPAQAAAKPAKDTLAQQKPADLKQAAVLPKDTTKAAPRKDTAKSAAGAPAKDTAKIETGSLWRPKDTLWQTKQPADTAKKGAPAAPQFPEKTMKLHISVTGDSCWARVYYDGKQWRKTLHQGRGMTFSARDSFNLHIGASEAVTVTVNDKPVSIPGPGVVSFKVDHNGVTQWTLDKWNSVFQGRY